MAEWERVVRSTVKDYVKSHAEEVIRQREMQSRIEREMSICVLCLIELRDLAGIAMSARRLNPIYHRKRLWETYTLKLDGEFVDIFIKVRVNWDDKNRRPIVRKAMKKLLRAAPELLAENC